MSLLAQVLPFQEILNHLTGMNQVMSHTQHTNTWRTPSTVKQRVIIEWGEKPQLSFWAIPTDISPLGHSTYRRPTPLKRLTSNTAEGKQRLIKQ